MTRKYSSVQKDTKTVICGICSDVWELITSLKWMFVWRKCTFCFSRRDFGAGRRVILLLSAVITRDPSSCCVSARFWIEEPNLGFVSRLIEVVSGISFVCLAARFCSALRRSSSISSVMGLWSGPWSLEFSIEV